MTSEARVRASRARLIEDADEARRRLERDLHDGAQQGLVLASLLLAEAQACVRGTPAEPLVDEAVAQLKHAMAELRDLAQGIHPAVLTDRGLAAALPDIVGRSPLPVTLRVTPRRVAAVAEAAIYFTVAEGLTNVAKHAQASCATVDVDVRDGVLIAEVADDGVGGASLAAGSGLRGLADRLDAVGGTLSIDSPPGGGTTLHAEVPAATARASTPPPPHTHPDVKERRISRQNATRKG